MKVIKIDSVIAYKQVTIEHLFSINGKEFTIMETSYFNSNTDDNDFDDVDLVLKDDYLELKNPLTDEELDFIEDNMRELVHLDNDYDFENNQKCKGCGGDLFDNDSIAEDRHTTCI